jgi:hypothetical protein
MAMDEVGAGDFAFDDTFNYMIRRAVNRPICKLALAANQNFTSGSQQAVSFLAGSEVLDDLNWHSTSSLTSRVVPTYAGRYWVNGILSFASNTTGERRLIITKNGVGNAIYDRRFGVSATTNVSGCGIIECNGTTDYIELQGVQASGGILAAQGTGDSAFGTMLEVVYMGDLL